MIIPIVRHDTICAILDFFCVACVLEISTTVITQQKEWTITEQTVESFEITILVTRKIFALEILEKLVTVVHETVSHAFDCFILERVDDYGTTSS